MRTSYYRDQQHRNHSIPSPAAILHGGVIPGQAHRLATTSSLFTGIGDTNYPHQPAFSLTQRAYEFLGAADRLGLDRYAGGHLFRGEESIPWLVNHLRG